MNIYWYKIVFKNLRFDSPDYNAAKGVFKCIHFGECFIFIHKTLSQCGWKTKKMRFQTKTYESNSTAIIV